MKLPLALLVSGGVLIVNGAVVLVVDFDVTAPWFYLALLIIDVGVVVALSALLVSRHTRIGRAFDVGYQAGYLEGRKHPGPVILRFDRRERER